MKFLVLFLSSTTLVAGGTAITSQQDVRSGEYVHQFSPQQNMGNPTGDNRHGQPNGACCIQEDEECIDNLSETDCLTQGGTWGGPWYQCKGHICTTACDDAGIFADIAKPLELTCAPFGQNMIDSMPHDIDLNGDGVMERLVGGIVVYNWDSAMMYRNGTSMVMNSGNTSASFSLRTLLNAHPNNLTYEGISDFGNEYSIYGVGYLDVTGDNLPDTLLRIEILSVPTLFYYVENISTPPAAACVSDSNNDGYVNVNDLIVLIADWGPCE